MKKAMIGPPNVAKIVICGSETNGLVDSGSQITSISESFYRSMDPLPELGDTRDFGIDLEVYGANGSQLVYSGYIKAGFYSDAVECWIFVRRVAGSILGRVRSEDIFLHLSHVGRHCHKGE